jgi:hypothetical protein
LQPCERIDQIVQQAQAQNSLTVALNGLNSIKRTLDSVSRLAGHDRPLSENAQTTSQNAPTLDLPQIYTVGRTFLIDHYHNLLATRMVRLTDGPDSVRTYQQLANLKMELRETGKVYSCLPNQHDDLAISCCMLAWACRHPHVQFWKITAFADRIPRPKPRSISGLGWT